MSPVRDRAIDAPRPVMYEHLLLEKRGHVAFVTFNRPEKANALHVALLKEIETVALSFRDDPETRVVVFAGAGKHFSSGADLDARDGGEESLVLKRRLARQGERTIRALYEMDAITIAAWRGAALGGGACIATALDFRVGAEGCFLGYPEIDIGVTLMWKSLPLCVHLVGPARAKRLVAGGERVEDRRLLEWGVLDRLVPAEGLVDAALEMAEVYAAKAPVAVQMIKQSINALASALDHSVMHMEADQFLLTATTDDRREAIDAYRSGRKPGFSGS